MNSFEIINKENGKHYVILEKIGNGSFGDVYKAQNQHNKLIYAIKLIENSNQPSNDYFFLLKFSKEISSCSFLLKLEDDYFSLENEPYHCIVTKYYEKGSLKKQIEKKISSNENFSLDLIYKWIKNILIGLNFLHTNNIIHRDLKPDNILIDDDNDIKIADFGISREIDTETLTKYVGTTAYMSPEIKNSAKKITYGFKTDIWSCGCILYELLFLEKFCDINYDFKEKIVEKFICLLLLMLVEDQRYRSSSSDIIKSFNELDEMNSFEIITYKDFVFFENVDSRNHNLPKRDENFVGRENSLNEIDNLIFNKNIKIISIYSESGNGKSSLALEFAHRFIKKENIFNYAFWLRSDGDILELELRILAETLDINNTDKNSESPEQLIENLKRKLYYYKNKVLFIFDNCENYENAKFYIDLLIKQRNILILITSKTNLNIKSNLLNAFELKGFNIEETKEFITKSLEIKHISELDNIMKVFSLNSDQDISPLILNSIIGLILYETGGIASINESLEEMSQDVELVNNPERKIFEFIKNKKEVWTLLSYSIFLDSSFIPVDMFTLFLKVEKRSLIESLKILKELKIITSLEEAIVKKHNKWKIEGKINGIRLNHKILKAIKNEIENFEEILNKYKLNFKEKLNSLKITIKEKRSNIRILYYYQLECISTNILNSLRDKEKNLEIIFEIANFLKEDELVFKKSLNIFKQLNDLLNEKDLAFKETVIYNLAQLYYKMRKYDEALANCKISLELNKRIAENSDDSNLAATLNLLGNVLTKMGNYSDAMENYQKSLETIKKLYNNDENQQSASCFHNIASLFEKMESYNEAILYYKKSLDISCFKLGNNDLNLDNALILSNLAGLYIKIGKYNEAFENYNKSLQIRKKVHGSEENLEISNLLNNIAILNEKMEKYNEALLNHEKSLEIVRKIYEDDDNEEVATSLNNIGSLKDKIGKYDEALINYEKSLKIRRKIYATNENLEVAMTLNNVGLVYKKIGKYNEALLNYKKALQIMKMIYKNEEHSNVCICLSNIGSIYSKINNYNEAQKNYEKALSVMEKIFENNENIEVAFLLSNLANVYSELGKYSEALIKFNRSLEIIERVHGNNENSYIAYLLSNIAMLYDKMGEYDEALVCYKKCLGIMEKLPGYDQNEYVANVLNHVALIYSEMKNYEEAILYYAKASDIMENLEAKKVDLQTTNSIDEVASIHDKMEQYFLSNFLNSKKFN